MPVALVVLLACVAVERERSRSSEHSERSRSSEHGKRSSGESSDVHHRRGAVGQLVGGQPLTTAVYAADPSAHLFEGRIYVYCSHDSPTVVEGLDPPHFNMVDFVVLSRGVTGGPITVHTNVLRLEDVPWASRRLWAPDVAYKDGTYYLFLPAQDSLGIFRIGVATAAGPEGPFVAQPQPLAGSYSIDPAVFCDTSVDGAFYLFFGGIWGGQLQRWGSGGGSYNASAHCTTDKERPDAPAILPRFARLTDDLLSLAHSPREVSILDAAGAPLLTSDHARRYFEGPWVHRRRGVYYLSWSTGNTHRIVYATAARVDGPYTYRGVLSQPVRGWTHHHSIVEVADDEWLFFYHDTRRSGLTHLRDAKAAPLRHRADGSVVPIRHHYDDSKPAES